MGPKTLSILAKSALPAPLVVAAFTRALQCAREFAGATSPNPPVGCVLLDAHGNQLAIAAHKKAGTLHAEALAIEQCRENGTIERIHTVVVTLEPCNHSGRTPPCTRAILTTPARQIWIGANDPNPAVCGRGAEKLAASGLAVGFIADLDDERAAELTRLSERLIAPFAKHTGAGLPWVTIKQAINSSGSMIPQAGRKTFTSPSSLAFAHRLRKRADAILTGSGTILADNPQFTVRHIPDFEDKHRHLVILDRRNRVPDAYLRSAEKAGFAVWVEASLTEALVRLGRNAVQEVLLEAGPTLLHAVLATEFWDEHITIKQGDGFGQEDHIMIRHRCDMPRSSDGKEPYVLRNY